MQLDMARVNGMHSTQHVAPPNVSRSPNRPAALPRHDVPSALPALAAASPPVRKSPPRLVLGGSSLPTYSGKSAPGPALTLQPASPAMSTVSPTSYASTPFPPPVASTSSSHSTRPSYAPSFQPPPTPIANGGGLAARRAAKLGKKRLSLMVPANPHSSLPSAGLKDGAASALLSPVTPSFLRPSSGAHLDAETRSLPPSPVLLTTFIGAEGSEEPDRTIGRLMLKQQADEMREQMRGGRGMKRRTSIPRLNLVREGAPAQPASLDPTAGVAERSATPSGLRGPTSAVQLIRGDAIERGSSTGGDEAAEEFPYANGPREILPGVFLGSEQNAKDARVLRDWRIGFVLNVAKEVECPWSQEEELVEGPFTGSRPPTPQSEGPLVSLLPRVASFPGVSRPIVPTLNSAGPSPISATAVSPSCASTPQLPPIRPPFMRPTASTPNLHAVFHPPSPPVPPVPAIPPSFLPSPPDSDSMARSLSQSPPASRRLSRQSVRRSGGGGGSSSNATATETSCPGSVRYAAQARTGRPELEYLWLKWGHDEADLVEAQKFQAAFAFLDVARERGERVLVHCQCGVSRSATVVIAYCMREAARALEEGRDADELAGCTGMHDTYSFVKEKSEWVGPNLSLVFQLVAYERTLRGDSVSAEDGDEPPYPHYPPEPTSARPVAEFDNDLPPPTPSVGFTPFSFPLAQAAPPVSVSSGTRRVNGHNPLPSPRTPSSSENSLDESQLSTPDLAHHDPLISPTFSSATKSSSVTSTPHSAAESLGLPLRAVRIVRAEDGEDVDDEEDEESVRQGRHTSLETMVGPEDVKPSVNVGGAKGVFVLPVPPRSSYAASLQEAVSPTVALYPAGVQQQAQPSELAHNDGVRRPDPPRQSVRVPSSSLPKRTSSLRPAAPPLKLQLPSPPRSASSSRTLPLADAPGAADASSSFDIAPSASGASKRGSLVPLQLPSPPRAAVAGTVASPVSPASTISVASPATLVSALSLSGSSSSGSIATDSPSSAVSTPNGTGTVSLARTHSTHSQSERHRFGLTQTPSERRASHRRVCSDTIRVPAVAGLSSSAATTPTTAAAGAGSWLTPGSVPSAATVRPESPRVMASGSRWTERSSEEEAEAEEEEVEEQVR